MTTYQLIMRQGPKPGQVYPLEAPAITVGRDPMSDLVLSDPEVSRYHARLVQIPDGGYQIEDMGSTNGTFIDGQKVSGEPVRLQAGQLLVFGSSISLLYQVIQPMMADEALTTLPDSHRLDFEATISGGSDPLVTDSDHFGGHFGDHLDDRLDDHFGDEQDEFELEEEADVLTDALEYEAAEPRRESIVPPPPSLPDFMAENQRTSPAAVPPQATYSPPPSTPVMPGEGNKNKGRRTATIIALSIFLLLCCCCSFLLLMYFYVGDMLLAELNLL